MTEISFYVVKMYFSVYQMFSINTISNLIFYIKTHVRPTEFPQIVKLHTAEMLKVCEFPECTAALVK